MSFTVIIPARLAASRLPGKPLLDIGGLPMIERVRRQAVASGARRVLVATDASEIETVIHSYGGEAVLTDPAHVCGTDRLAEVVAALQLPADEIVVNLQGDEPLMPPPLLAALAEALAHDAQAMMATVACPLESWAQLFNPHIVKVVRDQLGHALYFSRAPIPWDRARFAAGAAAAQADAPPPYWLRHIGLYAYRACFLPRFSAWPATPLEQAEALEQLRVLEHGERIRVITSPVAPPPGVDTPEDLEHVRTLLREQRP